MKRIIKTLTALAAAAALLTTTLFAAAAAGYLSKADDLNRMGLFLGTEIGYELDRVPTRAEAGVMLVRLLGRENEAKAGSYSHPFKDVPAWAQPYVGFLYEHGLTKGTSATTFEPETACSAQMYTTFVLRALGYTEENGSFTYDGALDFAEQLGLMYFDDTAAFLRDDMVAISYSALFQNERNSTEILLKKLVADGAVTQSAARRELDKYDIYLDYLDACRASGLEVSNRLFSSVYVSFSFNRTPLNYRQTRNVTTILDGDNLTLLSEDALTGSQNADSVTYYADGWLDIKSGDEKYKVQLDLDTGDYTPESSLGVQPFYRIADIYETTDNTGTRFMVIYERAAYSEFLGNFAPFLMGLFGPKNVYKNGLRVDTFFHPDGTFKTQTIDGHISSTNTDEYYALEIDVIGETNLAAPGDSVQIIRPTNWAAISISIRWIKQ